MKSIPEENYLEFQKYSLVDSKRTRIYTDEVRQRDLEFISMKNGKKYKFLPLSELMSSLPKEIGRQIKTLEGWLTIRNDLRFVNENLEFMLNADVGDEWLKILQSMYFTVIVTYAKCFNSANGRATLNKKMFFKKNKELEIIHDLLIEVRNNYVAHGASGYNTETEIFYAIEKNGDNSPQKGIESISAWIGFPNGDLLRQYQAVVHFVHDKLNDSMWSLQNRIQSQIDKLYTTEQLLEMTKYENL